jgi:hypothetical protein
MYKNLWRDRYDYAWGDTPATQEENADRWQGIKAIETTRRQTAKQRHACQVREIERRKNLQNLKPAFNEPVFEIAGVMFAAIWLDEWTVPKVSYDGVVDAKETRAVEAELAQREALERAAVNHGCTLWWLPRLPLQRLCSRLPSGRKSRFITLYTAPGETKSDHEKLSPPQTMYGEGNLWDDKVKAWENRADPP